MVDYQRLFDNMVIESQGISYAERNLPATEDGKISHEVAYNEGVRNGILQGITLGFQTMSEAGVLPTEVYDNWHRFVYSTEMSDPEMYRTFVMRKRSEE